MEIMIIVLIIIIIMFITILRDKNKEVEKYRKDWEFCKEILDKERVRNKEKIYPLDKK